MIRETNMVDWAKLYGRRMPLRVILGVMLFSWTSCLLVTAHADTVCSINLALSWFSEEKENSHPGAGMYVGRYYRAWAYVPGGSSGTVTLRGDLGEDFVIFTRSTFGSNYEPDEEITLPYTWDAEDGSKAFLIQPLVPAETRTLSLSFDDLIDKANIYAQCKTCGASCGTGATEYHLGCLEFRLDLGMTANGEQAGHLEIAGTYPKPGFADPSELRAIVRQDGVTVNYNVDDEVESVVTSTGRVDVSVIDDYSYELLVKDALGVLQKTVTVVNPDGAASYHRLQITESGDRDQFSEFAWSEVDQRWTLSQGPDAQDIQTIQYTTEEWTSSATDVVTETVENGQGEVATEVEKHYYWYEWGRELVKTVRDPSGEKLTSRWHYYAVPTDIDSYGRLKVYFADNGYWERYLYGAGGELVERIAPLAGTPYDGSDLTALRATSLVTEYAELDVDLADADSDVDRIKSRKTVVAGVAKGASYEIDWSGTELKNGVWCDVFWDIQSTTDDPESGFTDTQDFLDNLYAHTSHLGHRVTKRWRIARFDDLGNPQANAYETYAIERPDGTITLYDHTSADTKVIMTGYPNGVGDSVIHGVRTTTVSAETGELVTLLRERIDPSVNGGAWFIESAQVAAERDTFGRNLSTWFYFGADASTAHAAAISEFQNDPMYEDISTQLPSAEYTTSQTYGCCGVETRTDRYGLVTSYMHDDMGRTESMTRTDGVTLHYTYDAVGRTVNVEREGAGVGQAQTVDGTSDYDLMGRMVSQSDAASKFSFYTYRKLKADGTVYDPATSGGGAFYEETRVYPHNASAGPVRVTWTDSHGRTVLSLTGAVATDWNLDPNDPAPASIEDLIAVFSRVETDYDWAGRVTESRSYHNFNTLALSDLRLPATPSSAVEATHYYVQPGAVYDAEGRMVRSKDVLGNITVTVYDVDGRTVQTWVGTDDGNPTDPSAYHTPATLGGNLVQVSGTNYNGYGEMTESLRLKANLTALSSFTAGSGDAVAMNYEDDYTVSGGAVTGRESWSKPGDGSSPWVLQKYDEQGRLIESATYANGEDDPANDPFLAKSANVYDPTTGRMISSRVYKPNGTVWGSGSYLETTYAYDSAGRQFKSGTPGSGYSVTLYDAVGRVKHSLTVSDDNGTDTHTDDVVVTEVVYSYDAADNVIWTESYSRRHDTSGSTPGLLSGFPTADVDVRYSATWYDDAHRPTRVKDFGDVKPTPANP